MKTRQNYKKSEKDQDRRKSRANLSDFLLTYGIRPTRQRLDISLFLFDGTSKHVTAEQLLVAARENKVKVSLATIYNSLRQFVKAGMLKEVSFGRSPTFFDTNTSRHHHFFDEENTKLWDIPADKVKVETAAPVPQGRAVDYTEVTFYLA